MNNLFTVVFVALAVCTLAKNGLRNTGSCGPNATYTYDPYEHIFVVSGNGPMEQCTDFTDAKYVEEVVIKKGITSIGDYAFPLFKKITSVVIPDSVVSIGRYAFDTPNLKSLVLSNSLKTIGEDAFFGCDLDTLFIPDSVVTIGPGAFGLNYHLSKITIGESVQTINKSAFQGVGEYCEKSLSLVIPDSVRSLGEDCFFGMTTLKSVVIGKSVTSFGKNLFEYDENLVSVTYYGLSDPDVDIFHGCYNLHSVCVPSAYINGTFCGLPVEKKCDP